MEEGRRTVTALDGIGATATRRILIIDDDDTTRRHISGWLEDLGFAVVEENNGHAGLSRIALDMRRAPVQGVLLDLQMPVFSGIAVLKELGTRYPNLPVMVMVAQNGTDQLGEAMQRGARDHLVKPLDRPVFAQKC